MSHNLRTIYLDCTRKLDRFPRPDLEAKSIILSASGITEEDLFKDDSRILPRKVHNKISRQVKKRIKGAPLSYLTGKKEFWSKSFLIKPGVFIPRPETELLIEKALSRIPKKKCRIVDVGTGCGNVAVVIGFERPRSQVIAIDVSRRALKTAKLNASLHGVRNVSFYRGIGLEPLHPLGFENLCDVIISNPPYVPSDDWSSLSDEIRRFEPKRALVSGKSGLDMITELIRHAPAYLKPGGVLMFEIGFEQKEKILSLFGCEWDDVEISEDINKIPRVVSACLS